MSAVRFRVARDKTIGHVVTEMEMNEDHKFVVSGSEPVVGFFLLRVAARKMKTPVSIFHTPLIGAIGGFLQGQLD
jgi:hypothetical protein